MIPGPLKSEKKNFVISLSSFHNFIIITVLRDIDKIIKGPTLLWGKLGVETFKAEGSLLSKWMF